MNRFKTKRKPKDEVAGRSSSEEQSSMPSFRGFGRKKKVQEEAPKPEIDLSTALPSSDDFRTSLLMTGLSARFSMLKEQDDPNSKIGKASDDSVLFPKRQSRLMDMGYGAGLADIAEVESIRAPFSRLDSYPSDDADSLNKASIMDRGKPNEGNNLFGGRQKIYRIPAGVSSSKNVSGMPGRALYGDDVAQSAFQKWRQTERGRKSFEAEDTDDVVPQTSDFDQYRNRSESPLPVGYNRRRETNSTTSSTPSHPRNSTAATSVVSQPAASLKDWQSPSTTATSVASTPAVERSVTRTRRLYEQSLSQEMQDQQSSALSRIDTLSGRRGLTSRTPDLSQKSHSPSPTNSAFAEKFAIDRRPLLAKASAPNLRSISPPTTGSSMGTIDLGVRIPTLAERKSNFVGSPPLSPPVSETGSDHPTLNIQPNDRGKATAMGVFEKPTGSYDESKFVQRQLQLQQGRETPTSRFRTESNASFATGRSRSSSRPPATRNPHDLTVRTGVPDSMATFLDDGDDEDDDNDEAYPAAKEPARRPNLPLPASDADVHPALRQTATSTPRSPSLQSGEAPSISKNSIPLDSPHDSPTLGPTTAGLSGMVRSHLRSQSDASSIYGDNPQSGALDSRFSTVHNISDSQMVQDLGMKSNPWSDQDWSLDARNQGADTGRNATSAAFGNSDRDSQEPEDDFANQLANARRRVTERLTSYVESDTSRPPSPVYGTSEPQPPLPASSRPNPLGILRGKSSRGSLIDRSREVSNSKVERSRDNSNSKAMKLLGLGSATMSTSPLPSKDTFDEGVLDTTKEEEEPEIETKEIAPEPVPEPESDARSTKSKEEDQAVHPGLRAFRQARRELQKRKELETLARHQQQQQDSSHNSPPRRERREPSQDNMVDSQRGTDARSASRAEVSADRDRSGSESSGGPRGQIRPQRLRNQDMDGGRDNGRLGPATSPRPAQLRSPGLPGTDIRRSPIMPPNGFAQGSASPGRLNVRPANNMQDSRSGQPSPISPLGIGLPSPNMASNNDAFAANQRPRRPSAAQNGSSASSTTTSSLDESMKRVVRKKDISEPTFVMSTSRVPTVTLPSHSSPEGNRNKGRGRAGSNAAGYVAPPLPPINPARSRQPSKTRGLLNNFMGRNGDVEDAPTSPNPIATSPYESVGFSAFSDDMRTGRNNQQPVERGPPASRAMMHPPQSGRPGVGVSNGGMI